MKNYLLVLFLIILSSIFIACGGSSSNNEFVSSDNVYEMTDATSAGWKMKKGFEIAEFPNSTDARWGFAPPNGREVAIIRYPTVDLANSDGLQAAQEQTEYIEPIEGIKAYGDKVEKTACRGFADYPPPYKLSANDSIGLNKIYLLNKNTFVEETDTPFSADCPRREPFYRVYLLEGNLVFLGELMRKEDLNMVEVALKELAYAIREGKE